MENDKTTSKQAAPSELPLPQSQEATERIVHDLEASQVELAIENEALREAKFEVQEALEKYTDLYEFAPTGYFTLYRNGAVSAVNLAAANLLRIERSLLLGRSFEEFVTEEYRPTFTAFLEAVFTSPVSTTCTVVLLDNVSLPLTIQIEATACASGQECRLALINITGRDQSDLHDQATEPIISAKQQEYEPPSTDTSKAAPCTMELELGVCSLRESLDASLAMLREKALAGCLDIHLNLSPESDERIVADRGMLTQILFSLLANAIRFTPAGGVVDVSTTRDAALIKTTVTDSGIGISQEDRQNLFPAVTSLKPVYTKEFKGSGLCLALTKHLVELHGGSIWVDSEVGTGSRVSFTIPLRSCTGIT